MAPEDLLTANSLLGSAGSLGQLAGPAAASAVLAIGNFHAAFVIDAVTYLIGAAVIVPLPRRTRAGGQTAGAGRPGAARVRSFLRESGEGLGVIWQSPGLRLVVLAAVAVTVTSAAYLVVEPVYARVVLHRPPSQFALFEAVAGAGGVVTGLLLPRARRLAGAALATRAQRRAGAGGGVRRAEAGVWWVAAAGVGYGITAGLFTGTTSVPVAYASVFAWGCAGATFYTLAGTVVQQITPEGTLGRVFGVYGTLGSVANTGTLPVAGLVLAQLGIRPAAALLAAIPVVICLASLARVPRAAIGHRATEGQADEVY
jgi:hypothetical protein